MEETTYKILLIEDDKLDQMAFKRLVEGEKLPYDCTIAKSVSEAKAILGSGTFDVILADYSLGDGTAFDILGLVKGTPIVLVTGAGTEELAVKAWKAGAYDYLIKDVDRNYLKALPITVENALRHKKAKEQVQLLSGAVMSTDDSVYITDMENNIIFVNKAFCETYGYKREEILGKDSNLLWIGKPQSQNTRSVFQIVKNAWEVGFYHKRKDGGVFPVSLSRSVIKDENGNEIALVGVAHDISERMLVEDEFRNANTKLKEQSLQKSELAIVVSEGLKESLTSLRKIVVEATGDKSCEAGGKLKENLERADKKINDIEGVVNNFLDISKIKAGRMELKLSKFDLRQVVSDVVEELKPVAKEKGIKLDSAVPDSQLVINADHDRIARVLSNLVSNSIRIAPAKTHISVQAKDIGKEVQVEVEDDGPSVEKEEVNELFDGPIQVEGQVRSGEVGSVVGLHVVKELVEIHGGSIWFENRDEKGNDFCFSLPKSNVQKVLTPTG